MQPGMALVVVQDDEYGDQLVVQVHMKPPAVMQLLDEHGCVFNSADGIGLQVQCNKP